MNSSILIGKNKKNRVFQVTILILVFSLVKNPSMALESAKNGLNLWFNILLPSLLPFFILSELFIASGLVQYFGRLLEPIMKPIFKISGQGTFPLVMSFVSGYPVGAKLTSRLRGLNIITKAEGDRLITLASTSGPLYILGAVLIGMLAMPNLTYLMILPHYLGVITVGFIFSRIPNRYDKKGKNNSSNRSFIKDEKNSSDPLAIIISNSVRDGINSILLIGGFVIIYNVVIDILLESSLVNIFIIYSSRLFNINPELAKGVLAGFIELTTGCSRIAALDISFIIKIISINFLIGWGGLSILSQAISFISQTDINIKLYILSKSLHGLISAGYTYILYLLFYKDYILPSSFDKMVELNIYNLKNWLDNIYYSSRLSIGVFMFFIIFSLLVHNLWTLKNHKKKRR